MDAYMEEREAVFSKLQQLAPKRPPSAEARLLLEQIRQQDHVIIGRMTVLRDQANAEIDRINKGKRTRSVYEADTYNADSLFFDAKR